MSSDYHYNCKFKVDKIHGYKMSLLLKHSEKIYVDLAS